MCPSDSVLVGGQCKQVVPNATPDFIRNQLTLDKIPGLSAGRAEVDNAHAPGGSEGNDASSVEGTETPGGIAGGSMTSSRDELLDKVSTPEELETILTKFGSFIDDGSVNSVVSPSLGKVSTIPTGSYGVSYSWEPTNMITKEKYSILMLKFTDAEGNIMKKLWR